VRFTIWHSTGDPDSYLRTAVAAEQAGFTSTALHESVFFPEQASARYPYNADGKRHWGPETEFLDPIVVLTAILARTTTLRAFTFVMKFPLRHPLLVAKQATTLAILSGNRFGLGVGQSVWPEEFEYTQTEFASRRERMVEGIEIVRLASSGEMIEYNGEHYQFGRLQQSPGVSEPLPIYVGGHRGQSLEIAARYSDGWCGRPDTWEEAERCVRRLHELLDEYGRKREDFVIHDGVLEAGTLDDYRRMEELGVTDCIVTPQAVYGKHADSSLTTEDKVDWVNRFGDEIIARMT
jgi:probable F420-dependent oxidoreductase